MLGWSPDNRWLLYRLMPGGRVNPGGTLWLIAADGHVRRQLSRDSVQDAAFLPDGRHILYERDVPDPWNPVFVLIGVDGHRERVYRFRGEEVVQWESGGAYAVPSIAHAVSPSGHLILDRLGVLRDFSPLTGRLVTVSRRPLRADGDSGTAWSPSAAVSRDGRLFASFDGTVREVRTGRLVRRLTHAGTIGELAWAPNSRTLAYQTNLTDGSWGATVQSVDVQSGTVRTLLRRDLDLITDVSWSPLGRILSLVDTPRGADVGDYARTLFADPTGQRIWPMDVGHLEARPGENTVFWAPNGRAVAYVYQSGLTSQALHFDVVVITLVGSPV